jgi:hypothetical protein
LSFGVYFHFAGRVRTLSWNAVEFVIANNLREFGHYAMGAYYPPALWRPVLGSFAVLAVDSLTADPVLTFQIISGIAISIFVVSIYLTCRLLWGTFLASAGAFIAFTCPAITTLLLNSVHSVSHISMLAVLGPAVGLSVWSLLKLTDPETTPSMPGLFLAGVLWGLCSLARLELVLAAGVFLAFCTVLLVQRRKTLAILLPVTGALLFILPYHVWRNDAGDTYNLSANKPILQFYASQGWADPSPTAQGGDIEGQGYLYAVELYGDPGENRDSVFRAIARNPKAFASRVTKNFRALTTKLKKPEFFPRYVIVLFILSPLYLISSTKSRRVIYIYCALSFLTVAFFVFLHIDARYLTICVPFVILMASFTIAWLLRISIDRPWNFLTPLALSLFLIAQIPAYAASLSHAFAPNRFDPRLMRELARHFLEITNPTPEERARMYVDLGPPELFGSRREDRKLFYYYSKTALLLGGAGGKYPRGKIFSYRDCPATHGVYPLDAPLQGPMFAPGKSRKLGEFKLGELGSFQVFEFLDGGRPSIGCATPTNAK